MNAKTAYINEKGELVRDESCPYNVADVILERIHNARLIPRHRLSQESYEKLLQLYPHASNSVLNRCSPIEHPIKHAINQFWTDYCMWASRLTGDRPCFVGVNPYYLTSHEIANNYLQGTEPYFAERDNKTKFGNKHLAKTEFKKLSAQSKKDLGKYSSFVFCFSQPTEDVPQNVPVFILNYLPQMFEEPQDTQDGHYNYSEGCMGFRALNGDVYVYDAHPTVGPYGYFGLGGGIGLYVNEMALYVLYNLLSKDVYAPFIHRRGLHVVIAAKNRRYNIANAAMGPNDDFAASWASLHGRQRIIVPQGYYRYDYFNFRLDGVLQCVRIAIAQYEWYVNHEVATNFPSNLSVGAVTMFCTMKNYPVIDTSQEGELPESFLAMTNGHMVFMSNKAPRFDKEFMDGFLKDLGTARGFEHFDMPEENDSKALTKYLAALSYRNANGQENGALKGEPTRDEFVQALQKYASPFWARFKSGTQVRRAMSHLRFNSNQIKRGAYIVSMRINGAVFDDDNNLIGAKEASKSGKEEKNKKPPQSEVSEDESDSSDEEDHDSASTKNREEEVTAESKVEEKKSGRPSGNKDTKKDKKKKEKDKKEKKEKEEQSNGSKNETGAVSKNKKPPEKTSEPQKNSEEKKPSDSSTPEQSGDSGAESETNPMQRVRLQKEENKKLEDKEFNDEIAKWKSRLFGQVNTVNVLNPVTMCALSTTKGISYLVLTPRKKTLAYYIDYLRYLLARIREFLTGAEVQRFRTNEFRLTSTAPTTGTVIVLPPISASLISTYIKAATEVGNNEMQAVMQYFDDIEKQTCYSLIADFLGLPREYRTYGRQDLCSIVQRLSSTLTETFAWLKHAAKSAAPTLGKSITPLISSMINTCTSMIANATGALRSLCEWAISAFRAWLSKHRSKSATSSHESSASSPVSHTPSEEQLPSSNECTQRSVEDTSQISPTFTGNKILSDYSSNLNPSLKPTSCEPLESSTQSTNGITLLCRCVSRGLKSCCLGVSHALKAAILTVLPQCLKNCHYTLVLSLSQMCRNLIIVCRLPLDAAFWKRYMILLMCPNFYIRGLVDPNSITEAFMTKEELNLESGLLERLLCWPYVLYNLLSRINSRDIDTLIVETIMSDIYRQATPMRPLSRMLSSCTGVLGWILGLRIPAQALLASCSYNAGIMRRDHALLAWSALLADSYLECSSHDTSPEAKSFIATFMKSAVVNNLALKMFQLLVRSVTTLGPIAILCYAFGTDTWISACMMISIKLICWMYSIICTLADLKSPSLTGDTIRQCLVGMHLTNLLWLLESQLPSAQSSVVVEPVDSSPSSEGEEEPSGSAAETTPETNSSPSITSDTTCTQENPSPAPSPESPITREIAATYTDEYLLTGFSFPMTTTIEGSERAYFIRMNQAPRVSTVDEIGNYNMDVDLEMSFQSQFMMCLHFPYNPEDGQYEIVTYGDQYFLMKSLQGDITLEAYVGYWPHRRQIDYKNIFDMPHASFKAALDKEQKISSGLNAIVGDLSDEGKKFVYTHCDAGEHAEITPAGIPDQNCMPSVTIWSRFETTTFDSSFFGQTPTSYTVLITPFPNYPVVVYGEFLVNGVSTRRYVAIPDPTITLEFMVNNTIREFRRIGAAGTMVYTANVLNQNGTIICNQFPSGNDDFSMPTNLPIEPDTVSRATPLYVRLNIRDGFYMPIKYYEPVYEFVNCNGNTANLTINGSAVYTYATRLNTSPTAAKVLPNTRYCWGIAALSGLAEGASFSLKVSHGYQMLISGPCSLSSLVHPAPFYDVRALQTASLLAGWMAMAYPSRYNDWAAVKRWLAGAMENKTVQSISKTLVNAIPVVGQALSSQMDSIMDNAAKALRGPPATQKQNGSAKPRSRSRRSRSTPPKKESSKSS